MAAATVGCEVFGIAASMFSSGKTKAVYELQNQPTLVLVDDPNHQLGNPGLRDQIANEIGFHLERQKVIDSVIAPAQLNNLVAALGERYAATPVDQIGRRLGARQVIHVQVESVALQTGPGVIQPTARVQVKVIDADHGQRLFPTGSAVPAGGYALTIQFRQRPHEQIDRGSSVVLGRQLAQRIARDVARLFHDYALRKIGEPFDD